MKAENTPKLARYSLLVSLVVMMMAIVTGCTLDGLSGETRQGEVTQADLEAASKILGESLSDENDGVMASLNDALTTVSSSGLEPSPAKSTAEDPSVQTHDDDSNTGRGEELNYSYNYSSQTGMHTIAFQRIVHTTDFFKSVTDTLKYIFTDNSGAYIAYPRQNKDLIETIDYKAFREGMIETQLKESHFSRRDTFFIDGVSASSNILGIDGVHYGSGNLSTQDDQGNPIQRSYTTNINFLDIQIDKTIAQETQSLEHGVTGSLSWEMVITKSSNGNSETKTITGTVEMNGDGTALLRFKRFAKLFLINLDDGEVRDHDDEFEGRIRHVNIDEGTFTLASGRTVQLTDNTIVDESSDVTTLEQIAQALERGAYVKAIGEGTVRNEIFVAARVRFRVEESDERHFEGRVTFINLDTRVITINEQLTVRFNTNTVYSESGDLYSLEGAKEAISAGKVVYTAGYGRLDTETDAQLLAIEAKFRVEDPNKQSFEGHVTAVHLDTGIFTLNNELTVRIGDNTIISDSGDYHSLQAVADAKAAGHDVVGFGEGQPDNQTEAHLLGIEVKFILQN